MKTPRSPSRRRLLAALALCPFSMALGGCGFKLRGPQQLAFATLAITGGNSSFMGDLRQQILTYSNTTVVDSAQKAEATLQVLKYENKRETLSLSRTGSAREYTLILTIQFRLLAQDGRELLPGTVLSAQREYDFDASQRLALDKEEELLIAYMEKELIEQLLRRLAAVQP